MRHRNKINSLGRKAAHRKKTMSSMATALILNKRINTTVAKAKALRSYVEPLITRSKDDTTHSRRTVFAYLRNKYAVTELFREVSQKVADRPGGYTRILKTGFRKGDGAEMCFIELVDYNTHMLKTEEDTQQKRTRRGRRRGKKDAAETATKETSQAAVATTEEVEQHEPTADVEEKAPDTTSETPEAPVKETEEQTPVAEVETPEAEEMVEPTAEAETPAEAKKEEADEAKEVEKKEDDTDKEAEEDKPENK